jgi:hypothetical protein
MPAALSRKIRDNIIIKHEKGLSARVILEHLEFFALLLSTTLSNCMKKRVALTLNL